MFGASVIVGGKQIVLRLFPLKVKLQDVFQAFCNPDRERVAGFILSNQTYKYLRYSLGINPKPLEVRLNFRANHPIVDKFRRSSV